jgi:hypothetical protein
MFRQQGLYPVYRGLTAATKPRRACFAVASRTTSAISFRVAIGRRIEQQSVRWQRDGRLGARW